MPLRAPRVRFAHTFSKRLFRALLTCAGAGLGFLFGSFFGTMGNTDHLSPENLKKSTWTQVKDGFRESGRSGMRMSRGFFLVGGLYMGLECLIEKKRGRTGMRNAVYAGCGTGAALAVRSGPQAMAMGCAGFALFSTVIELVMGEH